VRGAVSNGRPYRDLQDQGFVQRRNISSAERRALFGSEDGKKLVVILTLEGSAKIDQLKQLLDQRYRDWLGKQSLPTRSFLPRLLPTAVEFARRIVSRHNDESVQLQKSESESDLPLS
jgi:hypothetical protein